MKKTELRSQQDVHIAPLRLVVYTLQKNKEGGTKYKMS